MRSLLEDQSPCWWRGRRRPRTCGISTDSKWHPLGQHKKRSLLRPTHSQKWHSMYLVIGRLDSRKVRDDLHTRLIISVTSKADFRNIVSLETPTDDPRSNAVFHDYRLHILPKHGLINHNLQVRQKRQPCSWETMAQPPSRRYVTCFTVKKDVVSEEEVWRP